jgi:O-antigen/teichoic acid export membrane protein
MYLSTIRHWMAKNELQGHVWQSLATYVQQGFGFILGIILARLLSPAEFGQYAYAFAVTTLLMMPFTWSLGPVLVTDGGKTPFLFQRTLSFTCGVVLIRVLAVSLLVSYFAVKKEWAMAGLCFLIGTFEAIREIVTVFMCDVNGKGNFRRNFYAEVASVSAAFLFSISAAALGWGSYSLVLPAITSVICYGVIFRWGDPRACFCRPAWEEIKPQLRQGFWLWLNNMAQIVSLRLDNWFVGRFLGVNSLGNYNRAFNYAPLSHHLLSSLTGNPALVGLSQASEPKLRQRLLLRISMMLLFAGSVNAVILWVWADPLVIWVFGSQWKEAGPLFRAFATLGLCLAFWNLSVTLLFSTQDYKSAGVVRLLGSALLLGLLLIKKDVWNASDVAIAVQVSLVSQGVVMMILVSRNSVPHRVD